MLLVEQVRILCLSELPISGVQDNAHSRSYTSAPLSVPTILVTPPPSLFMLTPLMRITLQCSHPSHFIHPLSTSSLLKLIQFPSEAPITMSRPSDYHGSQCDKHRFVRPPNSPPPNPSSTIFRNALSSTLGASVVATVVTPFDVIKIRLQAHVCPVGGTSPCDDPHHVAGSFDAVRKIVRAEGVRGLWRGLNVTLLLAIPTTGLYFTLYEAFRERIADVCPQASKPVSAVVAGASARIAAASVASPLELARTSLQAGVGGPHATVWSVLKHVRKNDGLLAWWRGLGPTLLRDAPFSAIYWSAYEMLKDPKRSLLPGRLFNRGSELAVYLGAGIGAGGLAALCTVPPDVVKTRRQSSFVKSADGRSVAPSSLMIARQIVDDEGLRGLFRGAGPRVAKVAPACAIMMGSYEVLRKLFGANQ